MKRLIELNFGRQKAKLHDDSDV